MGLFEKNRTKKNLRYTDEEIDSFVQYLRANNLTIDTEEDAIHFLKLQSNLDPAEAKKKFVLDDRLSVPEMSPMYQLWVDFPDYHSGHGFDPFEFMHENIMDANRALKENFYRINPPETAFDEFDDNQKDLMNLLDYLNECSSAVLRRTGKKFVFTAEQIEKMKNISFIGENDISDTHMMSMLLNDSSLTSMGGFESMEELEEVLADYFAEKVRKEESPEEDIDLERPHDAEIIIRLSSDKVHAWMYIIPPVNGGMDVTEEAMLNALSENGVVYGVNKFLLERIKNNRMYFKIFEVAKGVYPVNGTNGSVKELFSREENSINLVEDKHGNVNYKELGLIKSVTRGEVIAEVILPTNAEDGIQVTGEAVKGIDGKYPDVPVGSNTILSNDRKLILATIDGELYFKNNLFHVRKLLTIDHDIDSSIGNVNFSGDIIIHGNIREGFSVKCEGNMEIYGHSEGANIRVGGNLYISKGMFGGSNGKIEVGGNLRCRYLENCSVNVKNDIFADQVLNCTVCAEGNVIVSGEKGRIIGGSIFGGKSIKANYIGTSSGVSSVVSLSVGMAASYLQQKQDKTEELQKVDDNILKLSQNITYISNIGDRMNSVQKALLEKMMFQLDVRKFQKTSIMKAIDTLNLTFQEKCSSDNIEIKCGLLRSSANINFNGLKYSLDRDLNNMRVFREGEKVVIKGQDFEKVISE